MGSNYVVTGISFISEDELCHYGIKGMKWGVRRYQNPDGSLTNKGKKRYEALSSAADKAKKMSDMARKDSELYRKKASQAKTEKLSDSQYRKAMNDLFGNYSKDKKYVESEAKSMGYKDSRQMAKEHLGIGKEGHDIYEVFANRAAKAADFYSNLSDSYKNAPISSLSKKQIKRAKDFTKHGYLNNRDYADYNLKYDQKRYGLNN